MTYRPPPVRLRGRRFWQAQAIGIVVTAGLLVVCVATAGSGSVAAKQAQARQVLGQIQGIDANLEQAIQRYDDANVKLHQIEQSLRQNRHDLTIAKSNLKRAQALLSFRLVDMYTSNDDETGLGVLLGATSLNDFVNRVEAINSVSQQDAQLVSQVRSFKAEIVRQEHALARAHTAQEHVVASRAAERSHIESQLSQRRALLSSIHGQITQLQAQARAREIAVASAARARLAAQPPQTAPTGSVGVAASTPTASVAPPSQYGGVVGVAMRYLGVPYVWGGASPSGFDCSGLVMYAFAQVGVSLPHSSYAQYGYGVAVARSDLQPGDLVFFDGLGHVGIYIGGNEFIHAPHTGDVVRISSLTGWYASTYVGARRIL